MTEFCVLGIETSCDETAAALVSTRAADGKTLGGGVLLSQALVSQIDAHKPFGGVVPEIAARAHLDILDTLINQALADAGRSVNDLDAVAATAGPGLIGGVLVGVMTAKAIALVTGKPFIAVNHLEAHALSVRLCDSVAFPYLLLLVSGGHCQFLSVEGVGRCRRLGTTIDDAPGEAFDKAAKMLGLGHPGGPLVERAAQRGDPTRFDLPRPMVGRPGCDLSFSGLKTALRQTVEKLRPPVPSSQDIADLCAGFQAAIADCLASRSTAAVQMFQQQFGPGHPFVIAGGVAANATIRARLTHTATQGGMVFHAPPPNLCTDNGAMVAWAGVERLSLGLVDSLDFKPRPRWPLDENAPVSTGAGRVKA